MKWAVLDGHVLDLLRKMPEASVHCVVTSPPYWGLRDYGIEPQTWGGDPEHAHDWQARTKSSGGAYSEGNRVRWQHVGAREMRKIDPLAQGHPEIPAGATCECGAWRGSLGLEPTPELYVEHIVEVFEEVRRVLRPDGTLWLNLGDCYATGAGSVGESPGGGAQGARWRGEIVRNRDEKRGYRGTNPPGPEKQASSKAHRSAIGPMTQPNRMPIAGLKPKDLVGMPWRVAFALQAAGWWLRRDIVWFKVNPMPESVMDRPTTAHEMIFLLTKRADYFFDQEAVREPQEENERLRRLREQSKGLASRYSLRRDGEPGMTPTGKNSVTRSMEARQKLAELGTRNLRSVWVIPTEPANWDFCGGCSTLYEGADRNRIIVEKVEVEGGEKAIEICPSCRASDKWVGHFATFPEEVPLRCIAAGSSERGACPECGAGFERELDVSYTPYSLDGHSTGSGQGRRSRQANETHLLAGRANKDSIAENPRLSRLAETVGWKLPCGHGHEPRAGEPSIVLDPFSGSGTTGIVALKNGRSYVGMEIRPEYSEASKLRLRRVAPLLAVEHSPLTRAG